MYKTILQKITCGQNLTKSEVEEVIQAINNDELTEGQISGFLVALVMKGSTLEEITYIAEAMRKVCVPLHPNVKHEMMDTCGTGGGLSGSAENFV